jgi:hypothetical protein
MNSRTARNPEPFLYKWVTDSRLIRLPRNGRRCDACPTRLVGGCVASYPFSRAAAVGQAPQKTKETVRHAHTSCSSSPNSPRCGRIVRSHLL